MVLTGIGLYQIKDFLLGADLGFSIPLLILGLASYGIAVRIEPVCEFAFPAPRGRSVRRAGVPQLTGAP